MRTLIILLLLSLGITGCASVTVEKVDKNDIECTASYYSLFKDIDSLNLSACGGKGETTGSKINTALAQELFKSLLTTGQ